MKVFAKTMALAAVAAFAGAMVSSARGETLALAGSQGRIGVKIINVDPSATVYVSLNAGSFQAETAGLFNWTRLGGTINEKGGYSELQGDFKTYCVELTQYVWVPNQEYWADGTQGAYAGGQHYEIVPMQNAPNPVPVAGWFSAAQMADLRLLYGAVNPVAITSTLEAAMQLAIWEIVSDTDRNLATGTFREQTAFGGSMSAVASQAQTWLNMLHNGDWASTTPEANLWVMSSGGPDRLQDQLVVVDGHSSIPVPLPASIWSGLTLISLLAMGRVVASRRSQA